MCCRGNPSAMVAGPGQAPPAQSIETHVRAVAIVNLLFGGLAAFLLVMALASILLTGGLLGLAMPWFSDWTAAWMGWAVAMMTLVLLPVAVLPLLAGSALLKRRPAGRVLGFVTAAIALFVFPLGTAFGAYAIWALSRPGMDAFLAGPTPRRT